MTIQRRKYIVFLHRRRDATLKRNLLKAGLWAREYSAHKIKTMSENRPIRLYSQGAPENEPDFCQTKRPHHGNYRATILRHKFHFPIYS